MALVAVLSLLLAACGREAAPNPPATLTILNTFLPEGIVSISYGANVLVAGGTQPFTWRISAGSLPTGLTLDPSTGAITGTPTEARVFNFTVEVTDAAMTPQRVTKDLSIDVKPAIPQVELISQSTTGALGNGDSGSPAISEGGRYVVFTSLASNLVPNDTNNVTDIFIRDRLNGTTARVSLPNPADQAVLGSEANGSSFAPAISADGQFVAYASVATNLAFEDLNGVPDVFVTQLDLSGAAPVPLRTLRVSVALNLTDTLADLVSATSIGNSGLTMVPDEHKDRLVVIVRGTGMSQVRWIASNTDTTLTVYDAWTTLPDGSSEFRVISDATRGTNLPGTLADVFSATTIGNTTLMMTENEHFNRLVAILAGTGKGQVRRILSNTATTLTVPVAWNPVPDATSVFRVFTEALNGSNLPFLSNDGQVVAFQSPATTLVANDTTLNMDIFLHEPATGQTERVSVRSDGSEQAGDSHAPFLNVDGTLVAFESNGLLTPDDTSPLRDIFLHDRSLAQTIRLSLAPDGSGAAATSTISSISANGRFVLFQSFAGNLVAGDNNGGGDMFVRDLVAAETVRVSLANDGSEANFTTEAQGDISGAGRLVVFTSSSTNLVADDTNGFSDVFLRDRQAGTTTRIGLAMGGAQPNGSSVDPAISADGRFVAFASTGSVFIPNDTNNARDIFLVGTGATDAPFVVFPRLAVAVRGQPFEITATAYGGELPLFWAVGEGQLPPGLTLDPETGRISGVPVVAGTFRFTLLVWDSSRPRKAGASHRVTVRVKP